MDLTCCCWRRRDKNARFLDVGFDCVRVVTDAVKLTSRVAVVVGAAVNRPRSSRWRRRFLGKFHVSEDFIMLLPAKRPTVEA